LSIDIFLSFYIMLEISKGAILMKKVFFAVIFGLLIQITPVSAQPITSLGAGPAVAIGVLSAIGIDPIGLGLTGSSDSTPAAAPKATKDESNSQMEFKSLASMPASFDLLNQSAGGSLSTTDILN
jgi:hypothetical protein